MQAINSWMIFEVEQLEEEEFLFEKSIFTLTASTVRKVSPLLGKKSIALISKTSPNSSEFDVVFQFTYGHKDIHYFHSIGGKIYFPPNVLKKYESGHCENTVKEKIRNYCAKNFVSDPLSRLRYIGKVSKSDYDEVFNIVKNHKTMIKKLEKIKKVS